MTVGTTSLTGKAGVSIDLMARLAGDLAEGQVPVILDALGWTYGTGVNAVNIVYADTVQVADGGNLKMDLNASGTYLDIFGRALTLDAIKFLYVKNGSTDSMLTIGGGVDLDLDIWADTSDKTNIKAGGIFFWADVTAAGVDCSANKNLYLLDDGTGAAGNKDIDIIAGGLD